MLLSKSFLIRRRNYAPLSQTCTAGACVRSCKSRRALRPRKPDGALSRHGLGARRVALLAPRGDLDKYRHPLGYVGAITKILGKVEKQVPHFGRRQASRGSRRMYIRKGERSSRATGERRSLRRREGERVLRRSGGGVPEFGVPAKYHSEARTLCGVSARRGSLTPMSEDDSLFISPSTPYLLSEYPRDEQHDRMRISRK